MPTHEDDKRRRASSFLGREDLIRNKRASGRPKGLADLDVLEDE